MKRLRHLFYRVLRWSEQYIKTDMVYLVQGSFWLNLAQFFSALFALILSIAFAHFLSKESYGTYKFILSIAGLISTLSLSGLGNAAARAVAQGNEGTFIKSFFMNLKWSMGMTILGAAIAIYYFIMGNTTLALGCLILGCCAPLIDSGELYAVFPSAKRNFSFVALASVLRAAIASSALIITMLLTQNPLIIVVVYFLVHTSIVLLLFLATYNRFKPNHKIDYESFRLGKHLSIINIFAGLADNVDQILMYHFFGPAELAIYSYTLVFPDNLQIINKNIGVLATPKYAVADKRIAQQNLFRKAFLMFLASAALVCAYIIIAPIVYTYLFPRYLESLYYSQVYSLTLLFSAVLPQALLDSQIAIREKYMLNIISVIVKITLIVVGIYYYGIWGAVFARIISKAFGVGLAFYYAKKI